jgi:6-phosphogluconate dehydrogenase
MRIGLIGTGKMGYNMVLRLKKKRYRVIAHNRSPEPLYKLHDMGIDVAFTLEDLVVQLQSPRILWLMVSSNAVGKVLDILDPHLEEGDIVIDGGNSFYKDSIARYKRLKGRGVSFVDVGVSGGPEGALNGASLMIGGDFDAFKDTEKLFRDLSVNGGYEYLGESGAGHFAKMVHNGIEYGMMQSLAEGFDLMKNSGFDYDFDEVLKVYSNGSVISSSLVEWLRDAYEKHGKNLKGVSGKAQESGEGKWMVKTAKELGIPVKIIEQSLKSRLKSQKSPNYQGKVIQALRGEFGQHEVDPDK